MSSSKNATETDREPFLEAALDSYLASILDIAETVASIGTDVAAACQDRLKRLHASSRPMQARTAWHMDSNIRAVLRPQRELVKVMRTLRPVLNYKGV